MDTTLFNRIVDLLTPHMEEGDRRTLLTPAFSGYPIFGKIDWTGPAREFTVRLVRLLDLHGEIEPGYPALAHLLQAVHPQVGVQDQREIYKLQVGVASPSAFTKSSIDEVREPEDRKPFPWQHSIMAFVGLVGVIYLLQFTNVGARLFEPTTPATSPQPSAVFTATSMPDAILIAEGVVATLTALPTAMPTRTPNSPTVKQAIIATLTARAPASTPTPPAGATHSWGTNGATYVYVPGGEFIMGSKDGSSDEQPQHRVYLDGYWIMKTEVTNAQYSQFMDANGYTEKRYWSEDGWVWCNEAKIAEPLFWEDERYNGPSQPVNGISWYEAEAYTKWLSITMGVEFSLPTEAQWEKAARGTDGRKYPWGDEWDVNKVNYLGQEDGHEHTAPVGSYQSGVSPYGALDMAGNVWEWTSGWYDGTYYIDLPKQNPMGPEDGERRVLRGGSWIGNPNYVRAANRNRYIPSNRYYSFGVRVVFSPPDS